MKKLALILTLAFTMGLGASTLSAAPQDKTEKAKTECCTKAEKKACTEKKAECKEKKAECKEKK